MLNRNLIAAGLATVSILGGVLATCCAFSGNADGPDIRDLLQSPKTTMQMNLYGANKNAAGESASGLNLGYDYYDKMTGQRTRTALEYTDGSTEELFYRADGSKDWSRDFYPAADNERAILRSNAWFAKDGKTYVKHDVYHKDGTVERQGQLLADGKYELTFYCQDGHTIQRQQLFGSSKNFLSEKAIFCDTGKPIRTVEDGEYDSKILTLFREDGSVASKQTMHPGSEYGPFYVGDSFDTDGNVVLHFEHGPFQRQVQTMRDGKPDMSWDDQTYYTYKREISRLNPADKKKKLWTQSLLPNEKTYSLDKGAKMSAITEFDGEGKVTRVIEMNENGSAPARVILPTADDNTKIVHYLGDDGKIVKTVLRNVKEKSEAPQALPAELDPKIPAEELQNYDRPSSPEWDDGNTSTADKVYDFH